MGSALRKSGYKNLGFDIIKGKGCYVYDEAGKKYLDFESGVWCCALGHSDEEVNSAIKKQIDCITHTGYVFTNSYAEASARVILDILDMPGGSCSFLSSGTEAVELAVHIGKSITGNRLTLVFEEQYFGSYGSAQKKDPQEFYIFPFGRCFTCKKNRHCDSKCSLLKKIPFDEISSFLFEPGGKGGLAIFPPEGIVNRIAEEIARRKGFIIVNEITTGLGRTGKWFGFQHYQIKPDIVAMGKILGNGYPVSAVAINSSVSDRLDSMEFYYAQSHTNDPLACIVAQKVVNTLQNESLIQKSHEIGNYFLEKLIKLKSTQPLIRDVRGRGLTICLEFDKIFSEDRLSILHKRLVHEGYIITLLSRYHSMRFMPPFIITRDQIDAFIYTLEQSLISIIQ